MTKSNTIDQPLVLIGIPVFNGGNTILDTIISILSQDYLNFKIVICDNSSTDSTKDIVHDLIEKYPSKITYILNPIKGTAEENWNYLIKRIPKDIEYFGLYHADDIYGPSMISKQLSAIRKSGASSVFTFAEFIDGDGCDVTSQNAPIVQFKKKVNGFDLYDYSTLILDIMKYHNFLKTPSFFCRTEILTSLPYLFDQDFKSSADLDMWLRLAEKGRIVIINEPLLKYRISKTQGSFLLKQKREEPADFFKVMDAHIKNLTFKPANMEWYEAHKHLDLIMCALNSVRNNNSRRAKIILSKDLNLRFLPQILKIRFGIKQFSFGLILRVALSFGLEKKLLQLLKLNH